MDSLLKVDGLQVQFQTKKGVNTSVDGVSFSIEKGEILGIVGESGCGKSVTSLSILQLLGTNAKISWGSIQLEGRELLGLSEEEMCKIRGNEIAMIFQDPMTALNPTLTIGEQLIEPLVIHQGYSKADARREAVEVLKKVGIAAPEKRMKEYPHQLSGGMRQRVMIAMAVSCAPKLLIADEPTTALDVTIQAQILELMLELREKMNTAIILITHDMGVVAETADNILVLYAGKVVEYGSVKEIFNAPKHPYTQGLLSSIPPLEEDVEELNTIDGTVPAPGQMPSGCRFAPRCPNADARCSKEQPGLYPAGSSMVSCFQFAEQG
ncbi:MAG: ABC transporter ATP-binding protein [Lachnospiraceae bacterium]|nr:ABC transporter ATP-binding protein [Lachnospiraceae bacterium]